MRSGREGAAIYMTRKGADDYTTAEEKFTASHGIAFQRRGAPQAGLGGVWFSLVWYVSLVWYGWIGLHSNGMENPVGQV